jgi:hypothetical protein
VGRALDERAVDPRALARAGVVFWGKALVCVTTVSAAPASTQDGDDIDVTHRFPALIPAPAPAGGRLWLVLQRGVPVAGQALTNPAP